MRSFRILGLIVLIAGATSLLYAADISGKWSGQGDQGPAWVFNFKVAGSAVTGTMQSGDDKERPISDGKLAGDDLSFTVNSEWQGNPIKLVMKGKVAGEKIELRVDTDDGAWGTDVTLTRAAK